MKEQQNGFYARQIREVYNEGWNSKIWDRVADFLGDDTTQNWYAVFEACEIQRSTLEAFFTEAEIKEILEFPTEEF